MIFSVHKDEKVIRYKKNDFKPEFFVQPKVCLGSIKVSEDTDHIIIYGIFDDYE